MDITESQYKFNLAIDLVYYLMSLVVYNHPNKIETISQVLDKWDVRVNNSLRKSRFDEAKALAEKENLDTDVATIVVSAHQSEVLILKREFKEQVKQILINTMLQNTPKK